MSAAGEPSVELRTRGAVRRAEGEFLGETVGHWRDVTAEELGLPRGPLVAAGHQPEWWHPGIVAKFLWGQRAAEASGAAFAWLLVDTDVRDPRELRFPALRAGELRGALHRFGPRPAAGRSPCGIPACVPARFDASAGEPALPCVADGLGRAHGALLRHADAADAAEQAALALRTALPCLRDPEATVRTSALLGTSVGRAIVRRAASDPEACARAFNEAVRSVARVARPLETGGPDGPELPFWTRGPAGERLRVRAGELDALRDAGRPLWPRAFLTGLVARVALCDRFVHGTGAERYERATDAFARAWLGAALPPFDVASATLALPFPPVPGAPAVDAASRRRRWFDPSGDGNGPSEWKQASLAEIAALPQGSRERRDRWMRMHAELASARSARACDLAELEALASADRRRAREASLRGDRTWPAVLHPPEAVNRLAERVAALDPRADPA